VCKIATAREVGDFLRLNPNTIINLAVNGNLPGFKIGKSWRFDWDEVMARIDQSKEKSPHQKSKE
jgi:hypothetical protein